MEIFVQFMYDIGDDYVMEIQEDWDQESFESAIRKVVGIGKSAQLNIPDLRSISAGDTIYIKEYPIVIKYINKSEIIYIPKDSKISTLSLLRERIHDHHIVKVDDYTYNALDLSINVNWNDIVRSIIIHRYYDIRSLLGTVKYYYYRGVAYIRKSNLEIYEQIAQAFGVDISTIPRHIDMDTLNPGETIYI